MPHNRNRIVSRLEVEHLIANGHKIVIHNDRVLQLDTWIPKHPGGDMVVLHMVGRNATDEINAYVQTSLIFLCIVVAILEKDIATWTSLQSY